MRTLCAALALSLSLTACVTDDSADDTEDLGMLDGKADKITTHSVTLKPRLSSGRASRKSYSVTTAKAFRVSLAYDVEAAPTKLSVLDGSDVIAESETTWQPTVVVPEAAAARKLTIRIENSAAVSVPAKLHAATPDGRTLRIATFNIRWYGIGGDVDHPKAEGRNATLKAFIASKLGDADVIMFEEITKLDMLEAEVLPAGWACHTYENHVANHQFVVACHSPKLTLTHEADDTDFAYQPVMLGSPLRPAVEGVLRDAKTGAPLARLVGVHLKALPDGSAKRVQQVQVIADRLTALDDTLGEQLPTIVLGDFNSHRATDTGGTRDDWDLFSDVFAAQPALGLTRVDYPFGNTYFDNDQKNYKLDHIFLSKARATNVDVIGECNLSWATDEAAIMKHYTEISDHCPVVATVTLP